MSKTLLTAAACAILAATTAVATPNQIALTVQDGSITFRGSFVAFEDDTYQLRTKVGDIFVPAKLVTCEGDSCVKVIANTLN